MPRLSRVKLFRFALSLVSLCVSLGGPLARAADEAKAPPPIKIGYAISRTGPFAVNSRNCSPGTGTR